MRTQPTVLADQLARLGWSWRDIQEFECTLAAYSEGLELRSKLPRLTAEDFFFCVFRTLEGRGWLR